MSYISTSDVTANVAIGFDLEPYLLEADGEINDLAEKVGIRDTTDIEANPLHYKIKRFGIAYILMRLCQDKSGTNNVEQIDLEKYLTLYNVYRKEVEALRPQISIEMFSGAVDEIRDRALNSGTLFRG